ncbi:hypothetical protein [Candidatus Lokiarchaeum ossiferum]|uniref:hypothetical protein n=1 Tax=Candidatus Lokiarchaeum ossiferum TaxID=2951803 RepID=UPI00352C541C
MQLQVEPLAIQESDKFDVVKLPLLSEEQQKIINPIVPPTSGIRMVILDKKNDLLLMPATRQYMFLRVFKAISEVAKQEIGKPQPGVLLVSDDRPSANHLVGLYAKILAYDGYKIYFQKTYDPQSKAEADNEPFYSRMGTPHGSASVALFEEIDLVIVLTASHNDLIWNGVKFYIDLPMPISGRVMQSVSQRALEISEIRMQKDFSAQYIDADKRNNDYIIDLTKKVIDLSILGKTKLLLWPYMGRAPELRDLFERVGVDVVLIEKPMEPPNPTVNIDYPYLESKMQEHQISVAILLDTDRDRIVLVTRNSKTSKLETFLPNSLYAAMHSILAKDFHKKIINVRTIPSDPRGDSACKLSFVTGVGYKHLGMILYGALGKTIDTAKFDTGILYVEQNSKYEKLKHIHDIQQAIQQSPIRGDDVLMVLWEESGGHTINLLDITENNNRIQISSKIPTIGDKYPAEALLIICTLLAKGYNFNDILSKEIAGTRKMIEADDEKKVKIVSTFAQMEGQSFQVKEQTYTINTFQQVNGQIAIIYLSSLQTKVYFRPSGTGPGVRVYIFGPKNTIDQELDQIIEKINTMF